MREIKFRGRGAPRGKQWFYGDLDTHTSGVCILDNDTLHTVVSETVGQFTGLTDANGQEIYEGDVVAFSDYEGTTHKGKVYFRDGAFFITQPGMEYRYRLYALVKLYYPAFVIGNVHDNPELLEVEA